MTTAVETEHAHNVGAQPLRMSPLHRIHRKLGAQFAERAGWQLPDAYTSADEEAQAVREQVGVADVSAAGKLIVKGEVATDLLALALSNPPERPGSAASVVLKDEAELPVGGGYVARLTQDEFLIVTPTGVEKRVAQRLEQHRIAHAMFASVIDQTSGLAGLVVAGPHSRSTLSKLCALPLDATNFPNQCVAQTSLAKVHAIIVRSDLGEVPAFELYFERPYAEYVWGSILDAGHEFAIMPFGQQAKDSLDRAG